MPPNDSMEKPPTVEPTGRPIAVFSNSYARLPERFFARLAPTPATKPRLIKFNETLASELGINAQGLEPDEMAAVFAGNVAPPGAEPIAMAYAGHQFGNFVPQLGDGRAILLGEVLDRNGERRDVQLKGAGRTPFSRRGDGRAALGPVLREYLVSEAMHALGIPTTRARRNHRYVSSTRADGADHDKRRYQRDPLWLRWHRRQDWAGYLPSSIARERQGSALSGR
jgi:uncharacterized protein YdiU (UPF0061 family)